MLLLRMSYLTGAVINDRILPTEFRGGLLMKYIFDKKISLKKKIFFWIVYILLVYVNIYSAFYILNPKNTSFENLIISTVLLIIMLILMCIILKLLYEEPENNENQSTPKYNSENKINKISEVVLK